MNRATFLLLVFLVAFGVRAGAVTVLRDWREGPSERHGTDGVEFSQLAEHLARGEGYVNEAGRPTAFRAPGFPLFLAGTYVLFGRNYVVAHLAFCLLGALSCVLTYPVARAVLDEPGARRATGFSVVYLPHVYFSTVFSSEGLSVPLLAAALAFFLQFVRRPMVRGAALTGLFVGLTALTRPFAVLLIPLWLGVGWAGLRRTGGARLILAGVLGTVMAGVVVAPWTLRNHAVFGRFVFVATNGGSTFYGGNNDRVLTEPRRFGAWISTTELPGRAWIEAAPDEAAHDRVEWALGLRWVQAHRIQMPKLLAFKYARFWLPDLESPNKAYTGLQVVGYSPFLGLFVLAGVRCCRDRRYRTAAWWTIHATLAATILTALVFWGSPRFRDANLPVLMVYAAVGWETVLRWATGRFRTSGGPFSVPDGGS